MLRKLVSLTPIRWVLRTFFSLFYKKEYLTGIYFDRKSMGWLWAFRSLKSRMFGENRKTPWPVHPRTIVNGSERIKFPIDALHVFQVPGCYWQSHDATITIGHNCHIAPNVGIVTTNHDIYNPAKHVSGKDIVISDDCWIGMNSMILPGVTLGRHTVVAAGAVVSKSFSDGYCVIGGNPAKIIRLLDPKKCEEESYADSIDKAKQE